jgi:hypothetical protein
MVYGVTFNRKKRFTHFDEDDFGITRKYIGIGSIPYPSEKGWPTWNTPLESMSIRT